MVNNIKYTSFFEKHFKRYAKKYKSLNEDLRTLEKKLLDNPKQGIDLGNGFYKIRLAVKSKNKGKSGGFRVVTYLVTKNKSNYDINLLIIYDKSEISDITKDELLKIYKSIFY